MKSLIPRISMTVMMLASLGLPSLVNARSAHSFNEGEAREMGERAMGEKFGKFMGSFMKEMGQYSNQGAGQGMTMSQPDPAGTALEPGHDGVEERVSRRGKSKSFRPGARYYRRFPKYDPWGANQWGNPLLDYDPWGAAGFADKDWAVGQRYYSSGTLAPWEHEPVWAYTPEVYRRFNTPAPELFARDYGRNEPGSGYWDGYTENHRWRDPQRGDWRGYPGWGW